MFNMYTGHLVRISWNGVYSNSFPVKNGVKQGAVISTVLICCYIGKLLFNLETKGMGCVIGKLFVGALSYADDIVLIARTSRAMRRMLFTCDSFADNCNLFSFASRYAVNFSNMFHHWVVMLCSVASDINKLLLLMMYLTVL